MVDPNLIILIAKTESIGGFDPFEKLLVNVWTFSPSFKAKIHLGGNG